MKELAFNFLVLSFLVLPAFAQQGSSAARQETPLGAMATSSAPRSVPAAIVPTFSAPTPTAVPSETDSVLTATIVTETMPVPPEKNSNTSLYIISAFAAAAVLAGLAAYQLRSKKVKLDSKNERKDDQKCLNLKKLMEDKLRELTDLRGQIESKAKEKARDKVRETLKGTSVGEVLAKIERVESEYKKFKQLYEQCVIEFGGGKNKRLFITGIPTVGKSHLSKRLVEKFGGKYFSIDDWTKELENDPRYRNWVNFYWDRDERAYYTNTNYEEQWRDQVKKSEALWPAILELIKKNEEGDKLVIFEGVDVLPHLAYRDLKFPGIVMIGKSFEEVLKRNKLAPRWGKTEELQRMEADDFFNGERPHYKAEAEKYGYKVFDDEEEAFSEAVRLLSN